MADDERYEKLRKTLGALRVTMPPLYTRSCNGGTRGINYATLQEAVSPILSVPAGKPVKETIK